MRRKRCTPQDDADDLANLRIIKDCIVFNVVTGHFFRANKSAVFVLERLKAGMPVSAIVAAYQTHFEIAQHVAERDVEHFLNDMQIVR